MTRAGAALTLLGAAALGSGCATGEAEVAGTRAEILGGMETTDFPFVGALVERRSVCGEVPRIAICTVAVVAPDEAITAGHCAAPYRDRQLEVLFGARLDDPDAVLRVVSQLELHPGYDDTSSDTDLAILHLSAPVAFAPVALQSTALDASFVGTTVTLVGFGATESQAARKRVGTTVVDALDAFTFRYGPSPAMTCHGDSGGPALVQIDGAWVLVGITSAGDAACTEFGVDTRIDAQFSEFLAPAIARAPPVPGPLLALDSLCDASCDVDADCPAQLVCQSDDTGLGRCVFPQQERWSFYGTCAAGADCGSGLCVPIEDSCLCQTVCPPIDPPPPPPPPPGSGGGCALVAPAGAGAEGVPLALALAAIALLWRRRGR